MDLKFIAIHLSCLSKINQNVGKTKKLFRELKNEFITRDFGVIKLQVIGYFSTLLRPCINYVTQDKGGKNLYTAFYFFFLLKR